MTIYKNRFPYINELTNEIIKLGNNVIIVDLIDKLIIDMNNSINLMPFIVKIISNIPKVGKLIFLFYARFYFNKNYKTIDVINIHFLSPIYTLFFKLTNKFNKKIIITIWGSDMYRSSNLYRRFQNELINKAKFITVATNQAKEHLMSIYKINENKIRLVSFGIGKFKLIMNILENKNINNIKKELDLPLDKIIVSCGSNGTKEQRHLSMINAISELPENIKKKIYIILHMGYGTSPDYKELVNVNASNSNLKYLLIDSFITDEQVALLRTACDIVINIQTTDLFSASLQESILAKNILLVGDWLPYDVYQEISIFYLKTTLENLRNSIYDILENIENYKAKCENNSKKIYQFSSWQSRIYEWQNLYYDVHKYSNSLKVK